MFSITRMLDVRSRRLNASHEKNVPLPQPGATTVDARSK